MARHASTYRQARRQMARVLNVDWAVFNSLEYWKGEEAFKLFSYPTQKRSNIIPSRSKYVPHIGAKQRSKGAK